MTCRDLFSDGLIGQPSSVSLGELIVADQAAFQEGNFGGPLAKFAGRGGDGASERGAYLAQVGVVWGGLGLVIWIPGLGKWNE
jgi:hypothetical protein